MAIKRLFLGLTLTLASMAAWATPFTGVYNVTVNSSNNGLTVAASPTTGNLAFNLNVGDSTNWLLLFDISTSESTVNTDDRTPVAASIAFNFTLPTTFGGTSNGDTEGVSLFWGLWQFGVLTWDNGGYNSLNMGNGGILDVYLQDAVFGAGLGGLSDQSAPVYGKFTYRRAPVAVTEPATLSLIGGGLLLIALIRRRRAIK